MCLSRNLGPVVSPSESICVGLWSKEAPEASFLHVGFRAQCGERPALVWVVLWPVSSRPGLGVSSPLRNLSPPSSTPDRHSSPRRRPCRLNFGQREGTCPALPGDKQSSAKRPSSPWEVPPTWFQ